VSLRRHWAKPPRMKNAKNERPPWVDRMRVRNHHGRWLDHSPASVGEYLDSLSGVNDRLWPHERWPPMVLDGPLAVGARGGHGPIRYTVTEYEAGRRVVFRFSAPEGFGGTHRFTVVEEKGGARLRHAIEMSVSGPARFSWPVVFRPLHDALLEDALDKVEAHLDGEPWRTRAWSPWVKLLRGLLARRRKTKR
jgi:hypothetical protein